MFRSLRFSLLSALVVAAGSSVASAGAIASQDLTFAELQRASAQVASLDRDAIQLAGCGHGNSYYRGGNYYGGHPRYNVGYPHSSFYRGYGVNYGGYRSVYRGHPGNFNNNFYRGGYVPYGRGYGRSGVGLYIGF